MDCAVRGMTSWLPMDELLRSGRPKPQHWKSDESTEVEETSAEEDQDWNEDSDADWTIDSEGRSSLSGGSVCALVASDGQASLRRSISETDLVVAGFEEAERKTSEAYRKVFARARLALRCAAPRGVGDVHLVCRERVLSDSVGPCGYRLYSACLAEGLRVHDLPLEQYRARDELPLLQQWARGRADDRVTLPADLETMDLLTTATPPPTLRAAEPRRLRNDFEDFFGTRRPQLIRSAEIALPLLTSWDLSVVDKPADARSLSDKSTEQVLAETTRPCPHCFVPIRRAGGCVHMTCGNPRCQHEFWWLCLHDWTSATHDASFCTGRAEAPHFEVLASVERRIRSNWAQQAHDTRAAEDTYAKEVLQRFRVALITHLESDADLLSAEDADVLLRWRRFLEFYDHRETRIRATAQVTFAGVVDSHRAQQELIELLSWVRDRWWLRLSPEDVDAHNESIMDPQYFLELPCPVRRRMHAERALVCLEQHLGSQLVEYERNMAERTRQEVGANRAEVTSALEPVAANNAQLVTRGNVAFEQRDRAPRQTVCEEFEGYRAHITVEMQEDIPAHVEARIAEVRDFFREQFNEGTRRVEQHAREHCEMFAAALREEAHRELISVECSSDRWTQCGFLRVSMKSLLWLWLVREIVAENTEEECETVFCTTGIKISMVPYLNESCMSLSGMSSGPHGQTSAPAHEFCSANMSNAVCYKSCSLLEILLSSVVATVGTRSI